MPDRDIKLDEAPARRVFPPRPDPGCLAQVPDPIDQAKVHVCQLAAGHPYIPNACTQDYVHRCNCGMAFHTPTEPADVDEVDEPDAFYGRVWTESELPETAEGGR